MTGSGEASLRLQRLEELRQDLLQANAPRRAYAVETLLGLLWVEEGPERLAVACALCGYPPTSGKAEAPDCAQRLCIRLHGEAEGDDLPPPPPPEERLAWAGKAVTALLHESLDILKAAVRPGAPASAHLLRREADVCCDALQLVCSLRTADAAEACVRALRLFPPAKTRETGPNARQTTTLREMAARALGALSPDALFPLWYALGSPDADARRDLIPVLDYLHDARAVPYLTRLLERRTQWDDGELVGWFVVRAFERIGDRRALPALRRLTMRGASGMRQALPWLRKATPSGTSEELAREALRVIQSIEYGRNTRDSESLLRPAGPVTQDLLRPAADALAERGLQDRDELLRPEDVSEEVPAEPEGGQ
jgi:hypothetical protein